MLGELRYRSVIVLRVDIVSAERTELSGLWHAYTNHITSAECFHQVPYGPVSIQTQSAVCSAVSLSIQHGKSIHRPVQLFYCSVPRVGLLLSDSFGIGYSIEYFGTATDSRGISDNVGVFAATFNGGFLMLRVHEVRQRISSRLKPVLTPD